MPSFNVVNYSLRPNKGIQRALVFEGTKILQEKISLQNLVYVGFGSIWFSDFVLAHKILNIRDMISIEDDDIGFERAKFNKPYKTICVKHALSTDALQALRADEKFATRPWMVWLDYDGRLDETVIEDLRFVVENAPPNSILLTTFNADGRKYGRPKHRIRRIRDLLGDIVPDELVREDVDEDNLSMTLANLVRDYLISTASTISRPGGFVPAFHALYRDGASMVTIGGVLPSRGDLPQVRQIVLAQDWIGIAPMPVVAPQLTLKEAAVLQAELPRSRRLTRASVRRVGFDLEEHHIKAFEMYYRFYPAFAQIST